MRTAEAVRSKPRCEVWGVGAFENEFAAGWAEQLDDGVDLEVLETTIDRVLDLADDGLVPSFDASTCAIAAAETVATLADQPPPALPEEVRQWCWDNPSVDLSEIQPKAVQALGVLLQDSGLRRFFEERGEADDWEAVVEELRDRLWDDPNSAHSA